MVCTTSKILKSFEFLSTFPQLFGSANSTLWLFFLSCWTDELTTSAWLGGKFIEDNWTWLGQQPSLIDVKKWKLTETPEKDEYCLLAECYYTYEGDSCLHGANCSARVDWSQDPGSEIGFICEQEANFSLKEMRWLGDWWSGRNNSDLIGQMRLIFWQKR